VIANIAANKTGNTSDHVRPGLMVPAGGSLTPKILVDNSFGGVTTAGVDTVATSR
jgi:hypothetical protein